VGGVAHDDVAANLCGGHSKFCSVHDTGNRCALAGCRRAAVGATKLCEAHQVRGSPDST
jgi:hypothetical protein